MACDARECPKGDDPLTTGQVPHKIYLGVGVFAGFASTSDSLTAAGTANGINTGLTNAKDDEFILVYTDGNTGKKWKTWAISATAPTAIFIEEALEALPNFAVPSITVTEIVPAGGAVTGGFIFEITFSDSVNTGVQTLEVELTGCPVDGCSVVYQGIQSDLDGTRGETIGSGARIYTASDGVAGEIKFTSDGSTIKATVTAVDGTTELARCSNRGSCDTEAGLCECYEGYSGPACNIQIAIM